MDRKALVKKLRNLFCSLNREGRKYTEVWLSDVDFGGWYHSEDVVLHVKAEKVLGRITTEIKNLVYILHDKIKEEAPHIWRVVVYDASERVHCQSGEIMVYEEEGTY